MQWLIGDPRLERFLGRLPTFSAAGYVGLHPEVGGFPDGALAHLARHGLWEDRALAAPQAFARVLSGLPVGTPEGASGSDPGDLAARLPRFLGERIALYVHAQSPPTVRLAAELLAAALLPLGLDVTVRDETADPEDRGDHCVFFAPHDFFYRTGGSRWLTPAVVEAAVLCPTLPVHATPPSRILPMLAGCRGVIDGNPQNLALYARTGVACADWIGVPPEGGEVFGGATGSDPLAASLPPGLAPAGSEAPWRDRPIDLCLFGERCATRDETLVHGAAVFAGLRGFVAYPERPRDPLRPGPDPARLALRDRVARNARMLLAIDVVEVGSLDPYGMAFLGFGNGTLVVTRPLHRHPVFRGGEHFLEESSRGIAGLVEWVAKTPEGMRLGESIAAAGRAAYLDGRYRAAAVLDVVALLDRTRPPSAVR